jgi:hypothetical protein
MNIIERIEQQRIGYIVETGRDPLYLFLGFQEMAELDKKLKMITFRYSNMDVVAVQKERHISCGNKYKEV